MIFGMVRLASCLVPRDERAAWLAEWSAEYRHVAGAAPHRAAAFCLGAIPDALWMRRQYPRPARRALQLFDSAARCLAVLAILAAGAAALGTRAPMLPQGLVAISANGGAPARKPSVTFEQYRVLAGRPTLGQVAYYRVERSGGLSIAVGSANLLEILGVAAPRIDRRAFLLADAGLRHHPEILRRMAPIAGVAPRRKWPLPGRIDAFLLDPNLSLSPSEKGFVFAKIPPAQAPGALWRVFAASGWLECVLLAPMSSVSVHLLMLSIAFLGVAALILVLPGQYPLRWRASGWLFWVVKSALAAGIAALVCPPELLMIGYFAALSWAALDQRRRCPVCLRRLARPISIGAASHVLLDWYGTELMCVNGHGLLYEPELPASAYGARRWQPLDASWSGLFRGA